MMKKIFAIILLTFMSLAQAQTDTDLISPKQADLQPENQGCKLGDKVFPIGRRKQMNHQELVDYKIATGYRASDGYAVMMMCSYIVDASHNDHPTPKKRVYLWVAG
jgi:hypothetical protein